MRRKKKLYNPNISQYDPSRPTVGKIYRDLHTDAKPEIIQVGDMTNEILKDFVVDINDAIKEGTKDFDGRPFYILVHEKKDLQMKDALLRRIFKQLYRPYPEDDTTVFWHDPKAFETRFCWCLPHWSEMENIIRAKEFFDHALVEQVMAYRRIDLHHFGFIPCEKRGWKVNPYFKDKPLLSDKDMFKAA